MLLMPSSREALIDAINMNGDGAISLLGESLRIPYSVYIKRNMTYENMKFFTLYPDTSTLNDTFLIIVCFPFYFPMSSRYHTVHRGTTQRYTTLQR